MCSCVLWFCIARRAQKKICMKLWRHTRALALSQSHESNAAQKWQHVLYHSVQRKAVECDKYSAREKKTGKRAAFTPTHTATHTQTTVFFCCGVTTRDYHPQNTHQSTLHPIHHNTEPEECRCVPIAGVVCSSATSVVAPCVPGTPQADNTSCVRSAPHSVVCARHARSLSMERALPIPHPRLMTAQTPFCSSKQHRYALSLFQGTPRSS